MARTTAFSTTYIGGIALLFVVAAGSGLLLTGELADGAWGVVELVWLAGVAALLIAALAGARGRPGGWPYLTAVASVVLLVPLIFLGFTDAGSGSAVFPELGALVGAVLFTLQLRPGPLRPTRVP